VRVVPYVLILFILLTGYGVYNVYYLTKTSTVMDEILKELENVVIKEDWDMAEDQLNKFIKKWGENKTYWSVLINHSEIDNIEQSIERLKRYIKLQDSLEASAETAGLKYYVLHIPENGRLSIENIF